MHRSQAGVPRIIDLTAFVLVESDIEPALVGTWYGNHTAETVREIYQFLWPPDKGFLWYDGCLYRERYIHGGECRLSHDVISFHDTHPWTKE